MLEKIDSSFEHSPVPSTPILFLGGFGYGHERNTAVGDVMMHDFDMTVMSAMPDVPRERGMNKFYAFEGGLVQERSFLGSVLHRGKRKPDAIVSDFQLGRMEQIVAHVEHEGVQEPIDIIAQSADCLAALLYAAKHPEMVTNVVMINPAGLIEPPRFVQSVKNVAHGIVRSRKGEKHRGVEDIFESKRQRNDTKKLGGFAMAASVQLSHQPHILRTLRKHERAPGVAIVLGMQDMTVSPSGVLAQLESEDVDRVLITNTAHGISGSRAAIANILESLRYLRGVDCPVASPLVDKIVWSQDVSEKDKSRLSAIAMR